VDVDEPRPILAYATPEPRDKAPDDIRSHVASSIVLLIIGLITVVGGILLETGRGYFIASIGGAFACLSVICLLLAKQRRKSKSLKRLL
jgi:hypothetical protein